MKVTVIKPFHNGDTGVVVRVGDAITVSDQRGRDLIRRGLVEADTNKHIESAPSNKDAAAKRKTK